MRPQANNAQWDMRYEGGSEVRRPQEAGVGGSFVPTYIWAGWNGMTIHILFNSIKKGLLLPAIQIRGTAETRRCGADAVRLQVITWNSPLTLCALYLPLPPPLPAPPPVSHASVLIANPVNLTRGIQGCPKTTSFDKSNWHPNFWRFFSSLLFLCCFTPVHFRNTLCQKMHSLLPSVINPRILFPFSLSLQFFTFP